MTTESQTIADLAVKANQGAEIIPGPDGRRFLILPEGFTTQELLDDPDGMIVPPPVRIKQAVLVQTADSLVDYVQRFKTADTVLFADIASNKIRALIDYHGAKAPARLDHGATLDLPFSEEWRTWFQASGHLKGQLDFARFLEENAVDVIAPDGAELLEVCRDLQSKRKVDFRKAVRTSGGGESFEYSEESETKAKTGGVEVPTQFKLSIPVYFDGAATELFAFLRFKIDEGNLTLGYVLHRAEHVRQAVFRQIVLDVGERTQCPVVFGRPS